MDSLLSLTSRPPLEVAFTARKNNTHTRKAGKNCDCAEDVFIRHDVCHGATGSAYLSRQGVKAFCSVNGPAPSSTNFLVDEATCELQGTLIVNVLCSPFLDSRLRTVKAGGGTSKLTSVFSRTEQRLTAGILDTFRSVVLLDQIPNEYVEINVYILQASDVTDVRLMLSSVNNCVMMALADSSAVPLRNVCGSIATVIYGANGGASDSDNDGAHDKYIYRTFPHENDPCDLPVRGVVTLTCSTTSDVVACSTAFNNVNPTVVADVLRISQERATKCALLLDNKLKSHIHTRIAEEKQIEAIVNQSRTTL